MGRMSKDPREEQDTCQLPRDQQLRAGLPPLEVMPVTKVPAVAFRTMYVVIHGLNGACVGIQGVRLPCDLHWQLLQPVCRHCER